MNTSKIHSFFEQLFFKPQLKHWGLIFLLSPLSLIYAFFMSLRRLLSRKKKYSVPIISIGNLTVGGSGKTPFVISLAKHYKHVTIVSRGYGRESQGLVEVSFQGKVLSDVFASGDEAMLMAQSLPNASVIVSEKREVAIEMAIQKGAKVIFLDDGFNRVNIKKFEILLFPKEIKNYFPFPSGPFREFFFMKCFADISLYEEQDFKRVVEIMNPTEKMLLITAISNPERLNPYLAHEGVIKKIYLEDHAYFDEEQIEKLFNESGATSLLVTQKDAVKMEGFKFPLSVMQLELQISANILAPINKYIEGYKDAR
jgi:tetraacyldisaccharide 4'-kinase